MAKKKEPVVIKLPIHGITITLQEMGQTKAGAVVSDLENPYEEDDPEFDGDNPVQRDIDNAYSNGNFEGGKEVLYSMLLAHAAAGIDVTTPEYLKGVQVAVDAILIGS